jgi:hypothetical protein
MSVRRIAQSLSVVAVAAVLTGSSYVTSASTASGPHHARHAVHQMRFAAPVPHKYGANGMRMGLHCETVDMPR